MPLLRPRWCNFAWSGERVQTSRGFDLLFEGYI